MKKLFLLLILSFFSIQGYAGSCPDGSEPVKSISADGTYFVFNCGVGNSNPNAGTVKVAMKPFNGDWMNHAIYPATVKERLQKKYRHLTAAAYGDMNNDGIDDIVFLATPKKGKKLQGEDFAEITAESVCDITVNEFDCYDKRNNLEIYFLEDGVSFKYWDAEKNRFRKKVGFGASDLSEKIANNNPIDMNIQTPIALKLADFNGDGTLDIFVSDTGTNTWDGKKNKQKPKNDMYYLSQPGGAWLESTTTHVTGHGVKKGKGLANYSHQATVGDIDGDGDIDIVVPSNKWVGNNGEILCYVNQGDGHMVVRRCGDQWGFELELGDIDNDGDLDIVIGGSLHNSMEAWGFSNPDPQRSYHGVLLNDGMGNFYERGFEFPQHKNSNGFWYSNVPNISVADLDGDGDLDVISGLIGVNYQGAAMVIEENIGNGQFRTALVDEWCKGPPSKEEWPNWEGGEYGCHQIGLHFGDFNEDGYIDMVVDGSIMDGQPKYTDRKKISDGTVFLSTGKFAYDTIIPEDNDYPLANVGDCSWLSKCVEN